MRWLVVIDLIQRVPLSLPVLKKKMRRALAIVTYGGWRALWARISQQGRLQGYREWVERFDTLTQQHREAALQDIASWTAAPRISIVVPVFNPPLLFLQRAIDSVKAQYYSNWELCICDDASPNPAVREIITREAAQDPRIKVTLRASNGHISVASNDAMTLATGEWLGFLDHDDELSPDALYRVVGYLRSNPGAAMIYSDEDIMDEQGRRIRPIFKSDYNPDVMLSQNAVTHFVVARRDLVQRVGGFRSEVVGAQDWDLVLRIAEQVPLAQIVHIPEILYHWRVHQGSTAASVDIKQYVEQAQLRVVREHLARTKNQGSVTFMQDVPHTRVHFALPANPPKVSVIVTSQQVAAADQAMAVTRCVRSLVERTDYPSYEVIVACHEDIKIDTEKLAGAKTTGSVRIELAAIDDNHSRLCNRVAAGAQGDLLLFLSSAVEITHPGWLREMITHLGRAGVGVVGARLYTPAGTLAHAGIALGVGGIASYWYQGRWRGDPGDWAKIALPSTFSAITGACLLTSKQRFNEVGGFDEHNLPNQYNDLDLCLKMREQGGRCVYTPFAELLFHGSISGSTLSDLKNDQGQEQAGEYIRSRWGAMLDNDPYYNPNLDSAKADYSLAYPPRRSWKVQVVG